MQKISLADVKAFAGKVVHSDHRHFVLCGAVLASVLCAVFLFPYAPVRLWESVRDLWTSLCFYICAVFEIDAGVYPTVTDLSLQPLVLPLNHPASWDEFKVLWGTYWQAFIDGNNIRAFFAGMGDFLYTFSKVLTLLVPVILVGVLLLNRETKSNNDHGAETKALKRYKKVERCVLSPTKNWCKSVVVFSFENGVYLKLLACIWAYCFNFIVIILESLAFYFYFISGFDVLNIYVQVLKLLMDLSVVLSFLPGPIWVVLGVLIFCVIRRRIGFAVLEHMERKNRGFINERPIVFMVCGTMGKKKTTLITDMALSQEIMLRDKALEKILECDLKFPNFPWIMFERQLKKFMRQHMVYNLATARRFVRMYRMRFYNLPHSRRIFGYDFVRYGLDFDDNLTVTNIWDALEIYAQLYFIYVIQSSLLISNYSIRVDNVLVDLGNFPLWNSNLFRRDSRMLDVYSRHAHILDFDSLRLGRKVIEDNERADSFEFGVITITEIGKERGNSIELQQVKKNDDSTNQKNDLFNSWLKMVRHSATVDNFPFVKVITDEQRPESWGADARDLCEIVHIDECSTMKLVMPFFALEELVIDFLHAKLGDRYVQHRHERGDTTLLMYLLHNLEAALYRYKLRTYNQFGCFMLNMQVEKGTQDYKPKAAQYSLMCKKIYPKRFSTDCFSDFFNEKALRSEIGIDDLPEFATERASFDEMLEENSYFFNDLTKLR